MGSRTCGFVSSKMALHMWSIVSTESKLDGYNYLRAPTVIWEAGSDAIVGGLIVTVWNACKSVKRLTQDSAKSLSTLKLEFFWLLFKSQDAQKKDVETVDVGMGREPDSHG